MFENSININICLYVDDLLIFGSKINVINNVKSLLCNNFDMKDLEEVSVILDIKITRSNKIIYLDHNYYVEKVLKKYKYIYHKPNCTSYDLIVRLLENISYNVRQSKYVSIIYNLKYAIDGTIPDISHVVRSCAC